MRLRTLLLSLVGFSILFHTGCSRQVLKSPTEEINRTISLPPKNWQVSLGIGVGESFEYLNNYTPIFDFPDMTIENNFWYPYITLSETTEFHLRFLAIRQFLLKNVGIVDSTMILTGPNIAFEAGITGIEKFNHGFGVLINATIMFKHKLTSRFWVESAPYFNYYSRSRSYDVELTPVLGYQASKRLSVKLLLGYEKYRIIRIYPNGLYSSGEEADEYENYMVRIMPQYAINNNWSVYLSPVLDIFPQYKNGSWSMISGAVLQW